jgi:hypothetical protein
VKFVQALRLEAEGIMRESKDKFVPIDLGALKSSGKVEPVKITGSEISVLLAFGDSSAPYALAVHEHPSEHSPPTWRGHGVGSPVKPLFAWMPSATLSKAYGAGINWSKPGTGAKYLEKPMVTAIEGMASRIAARVRL